MIYWTKSTKPKKIYNQNRLNIYQKKSVNSLNNIMIYKTKYTKRLAKVWKYFNVSIFLFGFQLTDHSYYNLYQLVYQNKRGMLFGLNVQPNNFLFGPSK